MYGFIKQKLLVILLYNLFNVSPNYVDIYTLIYPKIITILLSIT